MTHMKRFRTIVCVLVAITLMVTLLSGSAGATSANDRSKIIRFRPITTSLLCLLGRCIDLKTSEGMEKALAEVAASGGRVLHRLPFMNALAVEFAENESATVGVLTDLLSSLYVLEVVDDLQTWVDPICPVLALQLIPEIYPWGQWQIEMPVVHQQLDTLPVPVSEVTVAVLDTGIDWTHLTLGEFSQGNAGGYYALDGEGSYHDNHGHGTHMAGIIAAARNYLGIIGAAGAAPQAKQTKLVAVKVLDQNEAGYLSDIVNGLQWIYDQNLNKPVTDRIRLVNMSFGFPSDSTPLRQAIQSLKKSGVIMVASVGNCAGAQDDGGGDDCGPASVCKAPLATVAYPAAYQGVLAVGATDIHDQIPAYNLSGPEPDVMAPGGALEIGAPDNGQILSTNTGGVYGRGHGTSQAAAHVTGAVALVLQLNTGFSFDEVESSSEDNHRGPRQESTSSPTAHLSMARRSISVRRECVWP